MKTTGVKILAILTVLAFAFSGVSVFIADSDYDATDDYEAKIGDTEYSDLAAALKAALEGDTVELLKDVTISASCEVKNGVTLNTAGYTLTANAAIENHGIICGNGTIIAAAVSSHAIVMYSGTLTGVTIDSSADNGVEVTSSIEDTVSITDCDFTFSNTGVSNHGIYVNAIPAYQININDVSFANGNDTFCPIVIDVWAGSKVTVSDITFTDCARSNKVLVNAFEDIATLGTDIKIDSPDACIWSESGDEEDVNMKFTIPADGTVTISAGSKLTVTDADLINNGTITNNGILVIGYDAVTYGSGAVNIADSGVLRIVENGSFSGKVVNDSNSATFTNLKSAADKNVEISKGSIIVSGTIDATDNVTIDATGNVKLNDVVITGTTGSLVITNTGGSSDIVIGNLSVSGSAVLDIQSDVSVSGTVTLADSAQIKIAEDKQLDNAGSISVDLGAKIINDGTIVNESGAVIENNGAIESSPSKTGTIDNAGTMSGTGTKSDQTVNEISTSTVTVSIMQYVTKDGSESGVYVSVSPSKLGEAVPKAEIAYVYCITADSSNSDLGTVLETETVDAGSITYKDCGATFSVDLKDKSFFANIVLVQAGYVYNLLDSMQVIAKSLKTDFDPEMEYITRN